MSYDRFAYGLEDMQCAAVVGYCDACGGEIYESNEQLILDDGRVIHDTFDCRFDAGLRDYEEEDEIYGDARETGSDLGQHAVRKAG